MNNLDWKRTSISRDSTHHVLDGAPLYPRRFRQVLKYHAPGLAPVLDDDGAYHIDIHGEEAYSLRFLRTFGFYQDRATVQATNGWHHILPTGDALYSERYAWCGNFQDGRCPVRDWTGNYFHLDANGNRTYDDNYRYAGDYRDEIACVHGGDGLYTHIAAHGNQLHGHWFLDLDVFHKGLARARDGGGWHHIDDKGMPAYEQRYSMVEPFYNGQARVEDEYNALMLINERGEIIAHVRPPHSTPLQALSSDMVGFWRTQTIRAAVELGVFDKLPGTTSAIAESTGTSTDNTVRLLRGLWEMQLVRPGESGTWALTPKGGCLTTGHGFAAAQSARYWAGGHYETWRRLTDTLLEPAASSYGKREDHFEQLSLAPDDLAIYHKALAGYARHDYAALPDCIDFSAYQTILDAGGGTGALLSTILDKCPQTSGVLFDRPEVVDLAEIPALVKGQCKAVGGNLFEPWPVKADAIILARVLHDWPDDAATVILKHARQALSPEGRLFVIEMLLEDGSPNGSLLDLNMLVMNGGRERNLDKYRRLLGGAGFELDRVEPLPSVSSVMAWRLK